MLAGLVVSVLYAASVLAQGEGAGNPPPPPQTLAMTMSGVLPVIPTETPGPFAGVETEEGAIVYDGPANPSFMPVNGPATTVINVAAATYVAMLPSTNFGNATGSVVQGSVMISSTAGESGVMVSVNLTGFPSESEYGPFVYHIHALLVPADGNCSATLGHLDPTDRGEYYPCNVAAPETCQVGDLAGKHGNVTTAALVTQYADPFLSTDPSSPAFFGDKSIVVHTSNTTRLTCANFKMMEAASNGTSTNSSTSPSQSVTPYTGAAANIMAGVSASFLGAAVALLV